MSKFFAGRAAIISAVNTMATIFEIMEAESVTVTLDKIDENGIPYKLGITGTPQVTLGTDHINTLKVYTKIGAIEVTGPEFNNLTNPYVLEIRLND